MSSVKTHFDYPRAFDHNRMFKTKRKDVVGCHDLHYLLQAQSRGLVVAAVAKLPGDNLPKGVYTVLVSCRPDVEPPDSGKEFQAIASNLAEQWEKVRCLNCDCTDEPSVKSSKSGCKRQGILFKFKPVVKTIYDPGVWSDERLADFCLRAHRESASTGRSEGGQGADGVTYWEGKITEEGKEYWMGGYLKNSKITNFFFIHPDYLQLKHVA